MTNETKARTKADYLASQPKKKMRATLSGVKEMIAKRLSTTETQRGHEVSTLRFFGVDSAGMLTDEQRKVADTLRRLSAWAGIEAPRPEDPIEAKLWASAQKLADHLGTTIKVNAIAKATANKLLRNETPSADAIEFAGSRNYAKADVIEHLFPELPKQDRLSEDKAANEELLATIQAMLGY